jgi:hypothetical protein
MVDRALAIEMIQGLSTAERGWQPEPLYWLKEHDNMAYEKTMVGGQDLKRINVNEEYELRDWATALAVTPDELREAVAAVGERIDNLRAYLKL